MEQTNINEVTIHPVYNRIFVSGEHFEGELDYPGDALGRDCMVGKFIDGWVRLYTGDGKKNEDWYGWNADVLAPFHGEIESISENNIINEPGKHSNGRAGMMVFKRADGVRVVYAHVMDAQVKVGDVVKAGDVVAKVGNNGSSWHPHIHIGAWKENEPLQIRFDLRAMGKLVEGIGDAYAL